MGKFCIGKWESKGVGGSIRQLFGRIESVQFRCGIRILQEQFCCCFSCSYCCCLCCFKVSCSKAIVISVMEKRLDHKIYWNPTGEGINQVPCLSCYHYERRKEELLALTVTTFPKLRILPGFQGCWESAHNRKRHNHILNM